MLCRRATVRRQTGGRRMPKSVQVSLVDEVQAALDSKLKPLGFRRKGRTYNRVTQDGLSR